MDGGPREIRYPFPDTPDPGEAVPVAEGVLWLRFPLPMALDHVNIYALDEGDGWTLIDTGFDSRKSRDIWQTALDGPLRGKPIKRVVLTHHHPDHVGLAGWFASEHGAELLASRVAWLTARMLTLDEQTRPTPETERFWRRAGMPDDLLQKRLSERPFNFADAVAPIPLGYDRLEDGRTIRLGGRDWTIRFGQGHAPDHATFWSHDGEVVLGGDQLLPSISPNLGVYATEPEADPVAEWLASIEVFRPHATTEHLVLPGHKLPYRGLPSRLDQLAENHHGALARLRAHLSEPRTAADCFDPLFRRRIGAGEYGLALVEAVAHCNHLWHAGEVERRDDADGARRFWMKDGQNG
ncbi:MBL fold metallo-hydrolase [Alphaproteobacteria bacterium GH1-50]|uniref:MBL fold metallo-hydrolase n=1 Tax=Kangsaoukella pontilimi TaxID=2691042 RepID=A0A7C9MST9_9RHOB|nr:MBL fold metallo-hydrolase [Kangsaoukella pontilimi]MXQ09597.1 MBL fold metallo-hydrolase [Kangsaoukella pontilimi]